MKYILIPIIALGFHAFLPAQTMERQVIGAAGNFVQTPAGALHFTVGETMIAPRAAGNLYWGEGFQQIWVAPLVSTDNPEAAPAISLTVYPNPAAQYVNLETDAANLQAQLFDLAGRPVTGVVPVSGVTRFDLSGLPAGLYLLRAFDENGRLAAAAKIQHIP